MEPEYFKITKGNSPVIASAIHCGHHVRIEVSQKLIVKEEERLREEDPFTDTFIEFSPSQIIVRSSRFEFDLNRSEEKAIYIDPEDSWGLKVWHERPSDQIIERSLSLYRKFYDDLKKMLNEYVRLFGKIFVCDVHSYNYKRKGPENFPDDPGKNPDINIGTGNIDKEYWKKLIEDFTNDLKTFDFGGHELDVRQNVKFKGGYFSKWINDNYGNDVCVLSVEIKKIFMNEWTGELYPEKAALIKSALQNTMSRVLKNLEEVSLDKPGKVS